MNLQNLVLRNLVRKSPKKFFLLSLRKFKKLLNKSPHLISLIRAFLQSLDEKVWQAVEIGWTKPIEALVDWDDTKIKTANFNSRALDALFSAITNQEFKEVSSTETTKEAWTILQTTYEGTKVVKDSKL